MFYRCIHTILSETVERRAARAPLNFKEVGRAIYWHRKLVPYSFISYSNIYLHRHGKCVQFISV